MDSSVPLLVAIVGLLGSSAVAAWLNREWERGKYEAGQLGSAYREIANAQMQLVKSAGDYGTLMSTYLQQGNRLWEYQKEQLHEAFENVRNAALTLGTAKLMYQALDKAAKPTLNTLVTAAVAIRKACSAYKADARYGDTAQQGIGLQLPKPPQDVADAVQEAINAFRAPAEEVHELYSNKRSHLLHRKRSFRTVIGPSVLLLFLIGALMVGTLWAFRWRVEVQPDRVVWIDTIGGSVRTIPIMESISRSTRANSVSLTDTEGARQEGADDQR